jgi:hypothetical protein
MDLMRSRAPPGFTRRPGPKVAFQYDDSLTAGGKLQWLPHHTDPDGDDSYVSVARELVRCGPSCPFTTGGRWRL